MADNTAKSIAKRLKSRGLQRLRWYCEMCKKQCRDENGFRNHCNTEKHLREMEKFSADSKNYIDRFSKEFEKNYLDVLSRHHHTKRINANYVYNEVIQDKNHVHMNSTKWDSLASFVRYLGETGKCEIDETERGWFVRWIDPEEKQRQIQLKKQHDADNRMLERQHLDLIKRHKLISEQELDTEDDHQNIDDLPEETHMTLSSLATNCHKKRSLVQPASIFLKHPITTEVDAEPTNNSIASELEEDEIPTWLLPNIIVKINSSKVGDGSLKNEKAVVLDTHNDHADLILLKSGAEVSGVPSKRLEPVIPSKHGKVLVLGSHPLKGQAGVITDINPDDSIATVKLLNSGQEVKLEFEDISKVFEE